MCVCVWVGGGVDVGRVGVVVSVDWGGGGYVDVYFLQMKTVSVL